MFPDFLIIGAQKAGTTWLQRNLQSHPQIWMPREKELHYFDEKIRLDGGLYSRLRGKRPVDARWRRQAKSRFRQSPKRLKIKDLAWDLKYFFGSYSDEWYASLFEPGRGKLTGETTPDYSILDREVVSYIYKIMPHARIVFMMRNPVERPWSAVDMGFRIGGDTWESVEDDTVYQRFAKKRTRLMTSYLRTLENWSALYPEKQIFVGFLEDMHFFPEELLANLYSFLGVDTSAEYGVIAHKIHSGRQSTMPTRFAVHLAHTYQEEISWLSERFGGYASFWHFCAQRLIDDPPQEEHMTYPLYESHLWEEWTGVQPRQLQSGVLSSLGDRQPESDP